jgi:hypothetical protein
MICCRKTLKIALMISILIFGGHTYGQEETVDVTALKTEVDRLKRIMPGQAVAMTQVAYNFSNLWYAVEAQNWALANFYVRETRNRLRWTIRISPIARTAAGNVDLQPLLNLVEEPHLAALEQMIADQTTEQFAATYDQTLAACYECHVAVGRPYLMLNRPTQPAESLINFRGQ